MPPDPDAPVQAAHLHRGATQRVKQALEPQEGRAVRDVLFGSKEDHSQQPSSALVPH